ncbi:MAG: PmoA family protein [Arcticibacter sp.]
MLKTFVTLLSVLATLPGFSQKTDRISVNNPGASRRNAIITFPYTPASGTANLCLTDLRSRKSYPLQILPTGEAVSIIDIDAGERRIFHIKAAATQASKAEIVEEEKQVRVLLNGKLIIGFQTGRGDLPEGVEPIYRRGGYIHPVLSPSGLQITDDYPQDHKHHHGVWAAWTKTSFQGRNPDFWNMAQNKGAVEFRALDHVQAGPVLAYLAAKNSYMDKTILPHVEALKEDFIVRAYNINGSQKRFYVFDIELQQRCATQDPLILLNHIYGGIAFRGNGAWNGKEHAQFLTSGGKDRESGNATNADWIRVSGQVAGKLTGLTILSHPSNFRAPQPLRIHPKEPYISFAPSQAGEFRIQPGEVYTARYRFIVYDGEADTGFIQGMWKDYSQPLKVEFNLNHD